MTPEELDERLDAMQAAAGQDDEMRPGLITVGTDDWIKSLSAIRPTCRALSDGLRHREIVISISSGNETAVLTRAQAAGRGLPYRDIAPKL